MHTSFGKRYLPNKGKEHPNMKKRIFSGIPAPFHAAVVFAVFFSLLAAPVSKTSSSVEGLWGIVAKVRAIFYDDAKSTKASDGAVKGGKKFWIFTTSGDPGTDPPPPPPPPPPSP
jgi:hypothetical protein